MDMSVSMWQPEKEEAKDVHPLNLEDVLLPKRSGLKREESLKETDVGVEVNLFLADGPNLILISKSSLTKSLKRGLDGLLAKLVVIHHQMLTRRENSPTHKIKCRMILGT